MHVDLRGRCAVITGGSDGIGAGCSQAFAEAGADVVIAARSVDRGIAHAEGLTRNGPGRCRYVACDVSDPEAIQALIDDVLAHEGRIDTLVNNAGQSDGWHPIEQIAVEDFVRLIGTNLVSYFAASKAALPHLRE